ncbi:MAG TPA: magnesium transporter [Thermodesulfobacteriota bacterium]|nr:magnesium transporter [Thermodesulfobacteriota bacterium]
MTVEIKDEHIERVKGLLERRDREAVDRLLSGLHASDIGRMFAGLDEEEALELFKLLTSVMASEVLLELDERLRKRLLESIHPEKLIDVVDKMETDDAADIISELPEEHAEQVLEGIEREDSIEVQKLLAYPEDTAGGKMQAELVKVREDATVKGTIEEVRKKSKDIEQISNVFVVDSAGRLTGVVSLDKLIIALPEQRIVDIADRVPHRVTTDVDQEEVARLFERYDLLSLPVVDSGNRLVGRITVDDVVDVIEEEIFEDFYRMAGVNKEERALDPVRRSMWMRFPWLLVNLGTAFVAASVVKVFQGTIEKYVLLAVLMPIVAGMGGNAGTQTITVVVRGLALGEFKINSAKRILLKEASVGLANGFLLGLAATVIAYLLGATPVVGLLLFLAMTANLAIAGLSGALIPLVLKWLKVDPAISSGIFVTTCTDIGGFLTFLGLATVFMRMGFL